MVGVVQVLPDHFCFGFGCNPYAFRLEFGARNVMDVIRATVDDTAEDIRELEEEEEPSTADAGRMRRFLEREILPWYITRKKELANRPLF